MLDNEGEMKKLCRRPSVKIQYCHYGGSQALRERSMHPISTSYSPDESGFSRSHSKLTLIDPSIEASTT